MADLPIDAGVTIPASDLRWTAVRASGPGGQNVNKVASKVDLRFDLEGCTALSAAVKSRIRADPGVRLDSEGRVIVVSTATRDQTRNLEDARLRLAEIIRRALRPPRRRRKTRPSRASRERRLRDKRKRSESKKSRGRVRQE